MQGRKKPAIKSRLKKKHSTIKVPFSKEVEEIAQYLEHNETESHHIQRKLYAVHPLRHCDEIPCGVNTKRVSIKTQQDWLNQNQKKTGKLTAKS